MPTSVTSLSEVLWSIPDLSLVYIRFLFPINKQFSTDSFLIGKVIIGFWPISTRSQHRIRYKHKMRLFIKIIFFKMFSLILLTHTLVHGPLSSADFWKRKTLSQSKCYFKIVQCLHKFHQRERPQHVWLTKPNFIEKDQKWSSEL